MARPGRLTHRIERLLNQSSFQQAFAGTGVRLAAAILLVPVALFAATAMVRVQAAQEPQVPPAADPAPVVAAQPAPAQTAVPQTSSAPSASPAATPQVTQAPAAAPQAIPAPPSDPAGPATVPAPPAGAPANLAAPAEPPAPPHMIIMQDEDGLPGDGPRHLIIRDGKVNGVQRMILRDKNYGAFTTQSDGQFYGLFERHGGSPHFTGTWTNGHGDVIEKAQKLAKGDFLLYTNRQGKSYYIDDPQTVAQVEALYESMNAWQIQTQAMAHAKEAMARVQADMAARQKEHPPISKADLQKQLAELSAAIAKVTSQTSTAITPEQLGDLQRKLGEMQGKLAQLQMANQFANFKFKFRDKDFAMLNSGNIDLKRGELHHDAEQKLKEAIDQALKNGTAKPLQ